jgi:hypothetical protein
MKTIFIECLIVFILPDSHIFYFSLINLSQIWDVLVIERILSRIDNF